MSKMANKKQHRGTPKQYNGSYYTYGNVAYDLEEYAVVHENTKKENRPRRHHLSERRENRIQTMRVLMAVFVLFAGCIIFMGMHVMVANADIGIRKQRDRLAELKTQTANLEAELAEQVDLDYIKQQATERLGMTKPQPYQIEYIDVPKKSYTVQYEEDEATKKKLDVGLSSVWDFFMKE